MHIRLGVLFALAACGGDGGAKVSGTARIVKGASNGASPRMVGTGPAAASDGHYLLSPNESTVTVTNIGFRGEGEAADEFPLTNCTPTYRRDATELTTLLDCPFEIKANTYNVASIGLSPTAQVTVDDSTLGLYTNATGLSTSGPAVSASVTVPTCTGCNATLTASQALTEPLVVTEGTPVTVTILEDMIHTMAADVSQGAPRFDLSLPLPPVFMIATAGEISSGSVEYYAPSGTAANYYAGPSGSGNEAGSARVFFINGKPSFVWYVTLGNSESYAADPRGGTGSRPGGYLGMDSTGTLCWAHTSSDTMTWEENGYSQICRMKRGAALGDTTKIECKHQNTAPAPTSGSTYESGCPDFTPDMTTDVTLVAK